MDGANHTADQHQEPGPAEKEEGMTHRISTDSTGRTTDRSRRRRVPAWLFAALTAALLALPAAAVAYPVTEPASYTAVNTLGQPSGHQVSRSLTADELAIQPGSQSTSTDSDFAWGDAAIGAGGVLALVAIAGAAGFTARRHGGTVVGTSSAPSGS
jgi:hypothetical protein